MVMDSERSAPADSPAAHCVVWHAPGVHPPADLMAALEKRHVSIVFCTGPYAALAEVCALDREAHREAPGAPAGGGHGVVLVLVQLRELAEAGAVVRAVELYVPRARCWRYDPSAAVRLNAVGRAELESATPSVFEAPSPAVVVTPPFRRGVAMPPVPGAVRHPAQGRPQLRLAGEGTLPARPDEDEGLPPATVREQAPAGSAPGPAKDGFRQVLTQDELAMLLDEDTGRSKDRPAPGPRRAGDST